MLLPRLLYHSKIIIHVFFIFCLNIYCKEQKEGSGVRLVKGLKAFIDARHKLSNINNLSDHLQNELVNMGKPKDLSVDFVNKKVETANAVSTNGKLLQNYNNLCNFQSTEAAKKDVAKELVNNPDIYANLLSDDMDKHKLNELYDFVKNFGKGDGKGLTKDIFKNPDVQKIVKQLPVCLSRIFFEFSDIIYREYEKLNKDIREILDRYLNNICQNLLRNTAIIDVFKGILSDMIHKVKDNKKLLTISDFLRSNFINTAQETKFASEHYKEFKPVITVFQYLEIAKLVRNNLNSAFINNCCKKLSCRTD